LLAKVLSTIEECVKGGYSLNEFKARLLKEESLEETEALILIKLFEKLSKLEKEGKNRIWTRVLKNSFAPLFAGKFDYVVGNPPWVNWENLPGDYREKTRPVWEHYHLIAKKKGKPSLGKAKRDMAMLFTYACIDRYLSEGGKFGFLITQTVFKSMAGEGFRTFWIPPEGPCFKVTKVHDLVELLPFEGAQNRTAAIFCVKGEATSYPLPYILWKGPTIDQGLSLEEVQKSTSRIELEARPLRGRTGPWSTLSTKAHKALESIVGASTYRAFEGLNTALNAAYWVSIQDRLPSGDLFVENVTERGKRMVKEVQAPIERDLVYPLLRGRDVERWKASSELYIVLPVDTRGNTLSIANLKVNYPKTYAFFSKFFDQLITRGAEPYNSQLKPWREKSREVAEKTAPPFYTIFNARPSLTPYKVVWREVSPLLNAAVSGSVNDQFVGQKTIIPDHTIVFVPCQCEDEAHFICAVLNSSVVRLIVSSYLHLHPSPHVMDYVRVPTYDPQNDLHQKLSDLSAQAHKLKNEGKESELAKIEEEIDRLVAQLYRLTIDELKEIRKCLAILEGKEIEEEESEEVPISEPDITIANPVIPETHPSKLEILLTNRSATPISNVKVKLELPTKTHEHVFHKIEKEVKIEMELEGLQRGEHKIRVTVDYAANGESRRIEKTLTVYAKSQEERKPIERAKIDEIFDTR